MLTGMSVLQPASAVHKDTTNYSLKPNKIAAGYASRFCGDLSLLLRQSVRFGCQGPGGWPGNHADAAAAACCFYRTAAAAAAAAA